ncbi:hypothetical protein BT96DRAFT_536617 [Gymnopus androsaceus JB14]|uniref:Uncharacterized protein n=1 Tax=Gymnopus androsaceus JB14 TaxID=1447944 RepID=A0A6A4HXG6_9AGAR|nr:hypothetical protein BT96DRAFT_536617 [Gymnopus androsaceus JB14]
MLKTALRRRRLATWISSRAIISLLIQVFLGFSGMSSNVLNLLPGTGWVQVQFTSSNKLRTNPAHWYLHSDRRSREGTVYAMSILFKNSCMHGKLLHSNSCFLVPSFFPHHKISTTGCWTSAISNETFEVSECHIVKIHDLLSFDSHCLLKLSTEAAHSHSFPNSICDKR